MTDIYRDATSGGLYAGDQQSPQAINKPFWARITGYDALTNRYSWKESTPTPTGLLDLPGGRFGSNAKNPAIEASFITPGTAGGWVRLQRAFFDPKLDWVYYIVFVAAFSGSPIWQYFKVTACPDGTGLYTGNIVTWDGTTETVLLTGERGVAANQALRVGLRYPARLTPLGTTSTTTTGTGTTSSTTTTTTTTQYPKCSTTTSTTTTTTSTGTTTTSSSTTTTSTTLPAQIWSVASEEPDAFSCNFVNPGQPGPPCTGKCEWSWSQSAQAWTQTCSSCSTNCACPPPTFCGTKDTQCATTQCTSLALDQRPPCCGTTQTTTTSTGTTTTGTGTTTTSTTTTTTTTMPPGCTAGCDWSYSVVLGQWMLISNGCLASCPCPSPGGVGNECQTAHTNCVIPSTTTTGIPTSFCAGQCEWYITPAGNPLLIQFGCFSQPPSSACQCQSPSFASPCSFVFTACLFPTTTTQKPTTTSTGTTTTGTGTTTTGTTSTTTSTTTSCKPTSTTPPPGSCANGFCTWQCDVTIGWYLAGSNCPNTCTCVFPPGYPCINNCQVDQTPCQNTTSTSTTTTSSSTTTTTSTTQCGTCEWKCDVNNNWVLYQNTCNANCPTCSSPIFTCQQEHISAITLCGPTTTSSTTTSTTTTLCPTTTTVAPTCGQCSLAWTCSGYGIAPVACFPIYSNCTGGCTCPTPPAPCCDSACGPGQPCCIVTVSKCVPTTTSCFVEGTPVLTNGGGLVPIEKIAKGTWLRSYTDEGVMTTNLVAKVQEGESEEVLDIVAGPIRLGVAASHPIYAGDGKDKLAGDFRAGDRLWTWNGMQLIPVIVESVTLRPGKHRVWNITMSSSGPPRYIAGGVAVHNKGG